MKGKMMELDNDSIDVVHTVDTKSMFRFFRLWNNPRGYVLSSVHFFCFLEREYLKIIIWNIKYNVYI
jgi:hypothetical protein